VTHPSSFDLCRPQSHPMRCELGLSRCVYRYQKTCYDARSEQSSSAQRLCALMSSPGLSSPSTQCLGNPSSKPAQRVTNVVHNAISSTACRSGGLWSESNCSDLEVCWRN
jgi:hypothetical protein